MPHALPCEGTDDGAPVDVLLIFPPQTEARFFPYLSLPYLTGHLRRRGRGVVQADLNIALLHDVLRRPGTLADAVGSRHGGGMGDWYRRSMAEAVARYAGDLRAHVTERGSAGGDLGAAEALRLARNAAELYVRDTFLARTWPDLACLDDAVRAAAAAAPDDADPAVGRLRHMVADLLARHRPRVVGLSVAFFSQLGPALLIAAWVRRLRPDVLVCLGGQQVMLRHESLAGLACVRDSVDALCHTAGEEPLERWLDALDGTAALADVPGMTWLPRDGTARRSERPVTLRFRDLGPPD